MAPHTRFRLAVIRTMRCDFCNKSNVDGLQECIDCNMHICRECVETGKLNNDEKHRMQQSAIDNLNWNKASRSRRATRVTITINKSASDGVLSKQERRQAKAERRLHSHSDHGTGTHFRRILPRIEQDEENLPRNNFNVSAANHEHAGHVHGHGHFQFASAGPGYPPGYTPSLPTHAMPHGVPSFGPSQPGQPPNQRGLAMPLGPIYGHHFSVNPGLPPRGDPRINTPPGQQFAHSGYPVPNNFGSFHGGQSLAYSPAPTPPGFAGPGFHQHVSQPPVMYNDRGYVPHGNITTGQLAPGPFHFTGQPYGGGPVPQAPPHQEQRRPFGQQGKPAQGGQVPLPAELARDFRARDSTPHGHAEQPVDLSGIERKQQQAWQREQPQQTWEPQQALRALQHEWEKFQRQKPMQQEAQRVAQQQQWQERGKHQTQPTVQQGSQTAQQAQKQNEQRQEQPWEQQSQQQALRPIPGAGAVNGPSPITASHVNDPPLTLPPITAPPITASNVQEAEVPDPAPVTPLPTLEPDPNSQLSRLQICEAYSTTPSVVGHAQRPFGIPALARDLYAGRPNHYDETTARWANFQSVRARRSSPSDDYEDYDDETESEADETLGKGKEPAHPGRPSGQPPSRGQKRTFSQASSVVDSTLSAELDQPAIPAAAAVVPGTEVLRRQLRDDADIGRARREDGERAALDMAAAANTLQGGGRGLGGVADAQVVANDREIRRLQEEIDRKNMNRGEGATEVLKEKKKKKKKHHRGGDDGGGDSSGSGGVAHRRAA